MCLINGHSTSSWLALCCVSMGVFWDKAWCLTYQLNDQSFPFILFFVISIPFRSIHKLYTQNSYSCWIFYGNHNYFILYLHCVLSYSCQWYKTHDINRARNQREIINYNLINLTFHYYLNSCSSSNFTTWHWVLLLMLVLQWMFPANI